MVRFGVARKFGTHPRGEWFTRILIQTSSDIYSWQCKLDFQLCSRVFIFRLMCLPGNDSELISGYWFLVLVYYYILCCEWTGTTVISLSIFFLQPSKYVYYPTSFSLFLDWSQPINLAYILFVSLISTYYYLTLGISWHSVSFLALCLIFSLLDKGLHYLFWW